MKQPTALAHTLRQAELHIQAGKAQRAQPLLAQVLKLLPKHPQANSRLGMLLLQTGRTEEAVKHLHTAVEAEPRVALHWLRLLSALQQLGDVQAAQDLAAQAAHFNLSAETLAQLAKVASEPPGQRQHGLLAMYQSGQNVLTTEIAARLFIGDYPDHPLGWQILASLLHDSGQLPEALDIKQQTVARFPNDANAHNNLAHTLLALQRYDEALVSARAALKINPTLAQARGHEQQALAGLEEKTA